VAKTLAESAASDELHLDVAAYHIQQAVEKAVKFDMQMSGIKYNNTHDMDLLWNTAANGGVVLPSWIYDNIDILNSYATKTRYGYDIVSSLRKISQLVEFAQSYISALAPVTEDG